MWTLLVFLENLNLLEKMNIFARFSVWTRGVFQKKKKNNASGHLQGIVWSGLAKASG